MLHSSHCPAPELFYKHHCSNTLYICNRIADVNSTTSPQIICTGTDLSVFCHLMLPLTRLTGKCMLQRKAPHLEFSKLVLGHSKEFLQPCFSIVLFPKETALIHRHHQRLFSMRLNLKTKSLINQKFSHTVSKVNYERIGNSKSVIIFLS